MKRRKSMFCLPGLLAVLLSFGACVSADTNPAPAGPVAFTFEDCMRGPHKLLKTYPAQCVTPDGKIFVDNRGAKAAQRLCKDHCGNGVCEEMVCMAEGCPCPESNASCPEDCKG